MTPLVDGLLAGVREALDADPASRPGYDVEADAIEEDRSLVDKCEVGDEPARP